MARSRWPRVDLLLDQPCALGRSLPDRHALEDRCRRRIFLERRHARHETEPTDLVALPGSRLDVDRAARDSARWAGLGGSPGYVVWHARGPLAGLLLAL